MNQKLRILGIVLSVSCGLCILIWFYLSTRSGAIWIESPFLFIFVPFLFFTGLWLLSMGNPTPVDAEWIKAIRRKMILIYLCILSAESAIFLSLNAWSNRVSPTPAKTFGPAIILVAFASYAVCYWLYLRKAQYKGKTSMLLAFMFLIGAILVPLNVLEVYNSKTIRLESIESIVDLKPTSSEALTIKHILPDRERWLGYWHEKNILEKSMDIEYQGLLPIHTSEGDTVYRAWVFTTQTFVLDRTLDSRKQDSLRNAYKAVAWSNIKNLNTDSVVFYTRSRESGVDVFKEHNRPIPEHALFLQPHYESFETFIANSGEILSKSIIGAFVILFVWALSSGILDRK